jgi:subtilisin family serine protease
MQRTRGRPDLRIGLIDGPVAFGHPDIEGGNLREIPGKNGATCARADSLACRHGTFVAGILAAKRGSGAPSICPGCTLLVRPIFAETSSVDGQIPAASAAELAEAIGDCVEAGARVINLSLSLAHPSIKADRMLEAALHRAVRSGVIVVAAAGNQGTLGSSAITRHQWVIPVVACDRHGRPMNGSNLGASIGRNGLSAPGHDITSIGAEGRPVSFAGTSAAVPFVVGAVALLWSEFPSANAPRIKSAVTRTAVGSRTSVVPPRLDAMAAFENLSSSRTRRLAA